MRQMLDFAAEPRTLTGKGPAHQLRLKGRIPGIVYGGKDAPVQVQVDERNFGKLYNTGSLLQTLMMLDIGGKKTRVLPRAVQLDPVTDRPVHVDFMRLEVGARIRIAIPARFKGLENSPGIKRGGVLNIVRHEIDVYCSADNIPEYLESDVSELDIGDSLHISHFHLPEGVTPVIRGRDFTVASLAPPTTFTEEVTTTAVAAEGAEGAAAAEGAEGAAAAAPGAAGAAPAAGAKPAAGGKPAAGAAAAAPAKGKGPEKK
ncbi:MAG: 50S ribosomal protein L25/general stress protein Ctc [Alphaproteobacteria bacterium]|nr:50S ribosomal protein L25/general stress protein Ctc [Alphaproteobacteria bacterium]